MHFFYSHLVITHHLHAEIELLTLEGDQKQELVDLISETVHQYLIGRILDRLHHDYHQDFLARFHEAPHDRQHLSYLKKHIPDIEDYLVISCEEIAYELIKTIRNHQSLLE